MSKIYGNTVGVPTPRPDWEQTDEKKASYIKNKPVLGALASKSKVAETDFTSNVWTMIDNKVDKVEGKGLSTNDFTDEDKTKLDALILNGDNSVEMSAQVNAANVIGLSDALDTKVDKEDGKGLASNDELVHCVESVDNIQTSGVYNINDDMYVAYGSASATGFGWNGGFNYVQDTPALTFNNQNDTTYRVSWGTNGVAYIHENWDLVAQTPNKNVMLDTVLEVRATGTTTTLRALGVESIHNITIADWAQSYVVISRDIVAGQIATKEDIPTDYYSKNTVDELLDAKANQTALSDYYVKDEVDDLLDAKADAEHTHEAAELVDIVPITKGGTGANNAAGAMTNLGVEDYVVETGTEELRIQAGTYEDNTISWVNASTESKPYWEYRKWYSGKYDAFLHNIIIKNTVTNTPLGLSPSFMPIYISDKLYRIFLPVFNLNAEFSYTATGSLITDWSGIMPHHDNPTAEEETINFRYWTYRGITQAEGPMGRLTVQVHGTWKETE